VNEVDTRFFVSSDLMVEKVVVTGTERAAWDKTALRLVGSPFRRLRISSVAALN
jgi:hypothetical protein